MKTNYTNELPDTWQRTAKVFTALGDSHRQRILLIFEHGERLNVSQIAETSTLSRPAVSHHLKILREAGVLSSTKEGKEVFYSVERQFLHDALSAVLAYIDDAS